MLTNAKYFMIESILTDYARGDLTSKQAQSKAREQGVKLDLLHNQSSHVVDVMDVHTGAWDEVAI